MDLGVKPDDEDFDYEEIKTQIQDYKENLLATLQSDHDCKLFFPSFIYLASKIAHFEQL